MASVKSLAGAVVDVLGAPLVGKTVTLKNNASGATITTTTTGANGDWVFANQDETLRYKVEAALGGSSNQVVVRKPASAEFNHLYANDSLRTAAGATVALGGAASVAGALTVSAGGIAVTGNSSIAGTLTGLTGLTVVGDATVRADAVININLQRNSTDNSSPDLNFRKSRGTNAAPTIVADLDYMGGLFFRAYDGAAYQPSALIAGRIEGTPGAGDTPGRLEFSTTPDGSATLVERMRITAAGKMLVQGGGGASAPDIARITDTFTGIRWAAVNDIRLVQGGVDAVIANATQVQLSHPLVVLGNSGGQLAFFAAAGTTKPSVTGSRGGNAALASLLTGLHNFGLVTDSSTA